MRACAGAGALLCLVVARALFAGGQTTSKPDFEELAGRAAALVQSNPQEAAELYRQALQSRPNWAEGWFYLGASLNGSKRYAEAVQAFQRAAVLAPDNGAVWGFLGLSESELSRNGQALADIRKGESLGLPDNLQFVEAVHVRGATICLRSHDFDGSVEQLRPLVRLGDSSAAVMEALGVTALTLPYLPTEIPVAKRALVGLAGRALYDLYSAQGAEGGPLFDEMVKQYGNEPGVHYLRGVYLSNRDPEAARAEFMRELQISPGHSPARLQIGVLDIKAGQPDSAAELARQVLQREPANPLAHAILGRAYANRSEYAKAIPELERAIQLDPENAQLHFSLGQAYRHVGRNAEAQKQEAEYQRLKTLKGANAG